MMTLLTMVKGRITTMTMTMMMRVVWIVNHLVYLYTPMMGSLMIHYFMKKWPGRYWRRVHLGKHRLKRRHNYVNVNVRTRGHKG